MMENIKQMLKRHEQEITDLQCICKHEHITNMPFMWAPGHFSGNVDVCDYCGKIIKKNKTIGIT